MSGSMWWCSTCEQWVVAGSGDLDRQHAFHAFNGPIPVSALASVPEVRALVEAAREMLDLFPLSINMDPEERQDRQGGCRRRLAAALRALEADDE